MKTLCQSVGLALTALWMGCADFQQAEQGFCARNPERCGTSPSYSKLAFTTAPQTVQVGMCSTETTVQLQDADNSPVGVTADTTVALSAVPPDGLQFFTEAGCAGTAVTSVTIRKSSSSVSFYFKGTRTGDVTISASSPGLAEDSQVAQVLPGAARRLVFMSPARTTTAGACSAVAQLQSQDAQGNPAPVPSATTVSLMASPSTDFQFYSDASCATAVASITLPMGASHGSFYFKGERAGTITLTAAATGLTNAVQEQTLVPGNASSLAFSTSTPAQTLLAGTCSMRTVESRDAFGNLATNGAIFNLSGSTLAEFFSDSGCTTSISQATIPSGSSSASFYFKGFTGGLNTSALLTLTASASGLTSATQSETLLPTVRTGDCTMNASSTIRICTMTPELRDLNKAFLVFQATTLNTTSSQANVRCALTSTTQLRCERADSGGDVVNIRWSVAELPSGVAVQHQTLPCVANTTVAPLARAVVRDRTFLLLSSERDSPDQGSTVPRLAELTATTQAELRKTGDCAAEDVNQLQVVEYSGASVQRGVSSLASGSNGMQILLPTSVSLDRSILLYSYIHDGSGTRLCDRVLRGELTDGGTRVTFNRGLGNAVNCAGSSFPGISWEVVQFPLGTVVHQVSRVLTAGTLSLSIPIPEVDLSRTIVIGGGQWASGQLHGEGLHSSSELISEMRIQAYLQDSTTLNFSRETASSPARFTAYVVQLKP